MDEKLLVFVLGAPGAGKGTQCDLIVKEYGWAHFSAGDLLRAQVEAGTEAGKQAEAYLKAGTMVPSSMIIGLLKEAVSDAQHTKVLIDGFPRVLDQLKDFEQQVRPCDKALFYNVPEEAAKQRLLKRGQTSGRVDDNEETIHKRFLVFKQESMPVITELESEGRAVEVDAAQAPEQVFAQTRQVIEQLEQQLASKARLQGLEVAATAEATAEGTAEASAAATAEAAAAPAAVEAAGSSVSPAASTGAQSPRASITPVAVSPVAAAAGAQSPLPASPVAAAAGAKSPLPASPQAAAVSAPAVVESPTPAASSADAVAAPPALAALTAAAAAAAAGATAAAVDSPVAASQIAAGSPAAAAAAEANSPSASSATSAAGGSPVKSAAGAAAETAAVSPVKPLAVSPGGAAAGEAAAGGSAAVSPVKPLAVSPVAVPPPGVPAALDVMSPTATGSAPVSPSPKATLASLQVDLSGIRTPIVICGPSGVGKGTLINLLMAQHPDRFGFSVSHTTRGPRPGEVHGKHYYFTEKEAMSSQVAAGMFLEHANVHGNMYGTSLAAVAQVSAAGKHCVLDIDVQGAAQVRKSALGTHCLFIFVAPPSHEELERRLRNRGTETEDKVLQRLANAESEIAKAQEPGLFHHVLVNAELEPAYQELQRLIAHRVPGLIPRSSEAGNGSKRTSEAGVSVTTPTASAGHSAAHTPVALTPAAAAAAAAATAALGGIASPRSHQHDQQQQPSHSPQQQQQHQAHHPVHANGNVSTSLGAAGAGGTAALLDFGFGASAGTAAKGMPVRQYMDATVIPVLREGLKALNTARPDDPLQFLADYLVAHKAAAV